VSDSIAKQAECPRKQSPDIFAIQGLLVQRKAHPQKQEAMHTLQNPMYLAISSMAMDAQAGTVLRKKTLIMFTFHLARAQKQPKQVTGNYKTPMSFDKLYEHFNASTETMDLKRSRNCTFIEGTPK